MNIAMLNPAQAIEQAHDRHHDQTVQMAFDDVMNVAVIMRLPGKEAGHRRVDLFQGGCRPEERQNRCGIGGPGVLHAGRRLGEPATPGPAMADGLSLVKHPPQGQQQQRGRQKKGRAQGDGGGVVGKGLERNPAIIQTQGRHGLDRQEHEGAGIDADDRTGGRQDHHGQEHGRALFIHRSGCFTSGLALEDHAHDLGKTSQGQAADHGQADDGQQTIGKYRRTGGNPAEASQVNEKFADESIEGGQAGDGQGPDEKGHAGDFHPFQQTAQGVDGSGSGFMQDHARAHEKKGLEDGVIEHVQEGAGKAEDGHDGVLGLHADHADAHADQDDADVLHAVIGQEAFQVVLAQGIDHAEHAGENTENQHHATHGRRMQVQDAVNP
ncbi:hypothetical protein DESC_270035 [Desulfosarcina cetonica]|nr:hypothetical protein DESC_270035 [Desulfosarcina cetonica]